ncbi:unnamed protein product [Schistosoma margrebowiei]|uniref:Uncharacterized protein n=1 Tax=Schistosoma margrebowiei TaxID=48269 RepID=A0A183LBL7_9TREM|nr:unnamed protein product [Schistosoma margrebowiei]
MHLTGFVREMAAFVFIQILTVYIICDDIRISYQQVGSKLKLTQNNTDLVRQTGAVKITILSAATFLHVAAWYSAHQIIDHILKGHSDSLIEKKTVNGRNALHHGVVGDPETAVVLCCINKKLVMVADSVSQLNISFTT